MFTFFANHLKKYTVGKMNDFHFSFEEPSHLQRCFINLNLYGTSDTLLFTNVTSKIAEEIKEGYQALQIGKIERSMGMSIVPLRSKFVCFFDL